MTIKTRYTQNAKLLITHTANPNLTGGWNHDTPLHVAVDINDANAIKMLIDAGADVNAKAKNGDTPLIRALREDNTGMAELILAKGADIGETDEEKTELFFFSSLEWVKESC